MSEESPTRLDEPDFGDLAEELEEATARVRKAAAELPPLQELAEMQEAMLGLAQMGALTERMRLVAQQHAKAVAERVGNPNWRVEAAIQVRRATSLLMKVELTADFDLGKVTEVHQVARSAEVSPETSSGRELALIRELKALDCEVTDAPEASPEELRLSPEANVPLETSDEGELCLDFAPALTARVPKDDPQWESGDLPCFAPMIDSVRVDLRDFEAGLPFERRLTVEQEQLIIELKLAFRPL